MSYCIIIPARLHSVRMEHKLLRQVGGMSIVEHTWRRACRSRADRVVVATDADAIAGQMRAAGAEVCMTPADLPSGTARVHCAARALGLDDSEMIINVQADEPLIDPALIDELAAFALARPRDSIATCASPPSPLNDCLGPDTVKVVCDKNQRALYFSRSLIPWRRDASGTLADALVHTGIYAYPLEYLHRFTGYSPSPLEQSEKLEQLRALWHGDSIAVLVRPAGEHIGIDNEDDLKRFERWWSEQAAP